MATYTKTRLNVHNLVISGSIFKIAPLVCIYAYLCHGSVLGVWHSSRVHVAHSYHDITNSDWFNSQCFHVITVSILQLQHLFSYHLQNQSSTFFSF